ncbi:MGH1-like glycoside hydrolase domain-containing protein [Chitinophaga qingshengii]|uniref:Glycoside hydrolase n=1 Tax=Chitinophaga qingshengii TaxID=1569794 RepID=A0ABR7TV10_9BACT|nr:trehalase family glycosidase [Chitinophaga qingshengii]MBC9934324.1 glycoside hydrolase [Chitinophaga qingshengii]
MNKIKWILALLLTQQAARAQRNHFADVLDIHYTVKDTNRIAASFFSDNGAWHAYALPAHATGTGFTGPLLMDMKGEWLSKGIAQLHLYADGKELPLQQDTAVTHYYPGLLQLGYQAGPVKVSMQLIFTSNREATIQTMVRNTGRQPLQLRLQWQGNTLLKRAQYVKDGDALRIAIAGTRHVFGLRWWSEGPWDIRTTADGYTAERHISLPAGAEVEDLQTQGFWPEGNIAAASKPVFVNELQQNEQRWNAYLKRLFSHMPFSEKDRFRSRLAVKSMITLLTNWRSASGHILHDGVFPSASYQGFYGIWSWDSWKQAVGLAYFAPELAEQNILTMFDYQTTSGMVPDCIYADSTENNFRDTKPPLAAWAVWEVFAATHDTAFLRKMYPALERYHAWWYAERDHDRNGLCEFGSTDGTRIAAAWESGMDNAVRFDKAKMLQNAPGAWSLDQESVDLNVYLSKEKTILAQMASVLGNPAAAAAWRQQGTALNQLINTAFYDSASGYYYDRHLNGELIRVKGPEAWVALWAGIAPASRIKKMTQYMLDTTVFNTLVPLPVLDASEKAFDPQRGYWRGPVWIDQFYFGVKGLQLYKQQQAAKTLVNKLWQHAAGMKDDQPLHENYHPHTGKGLNAENFSWTAAHILMLLAGKF